MKNNIIALSFALVPYYNISLKEIIMKGKILFFVLIVVFCAATIPAQSADNPALKTIINNFGARNYSAGTVTKAELDLILQAGLRAPSASNRQPWHFTVVQNQALVKKIISQATDGNMLIVVSGAGDNKTNASLVLDCALAVESIYLAAQALGLGSRIYTGPIDNLNNTLKAELGLPAGHNAVAVIRIGRLPAGVDALSSASPRANAGEKVTYK